jgi:hypothetical protein
VHIIFNVSSLVLSTALAFFVSHALLGAMPLLAFLVLATILLYATNSIMVAMVICLSEIKPLRTVWQLVYFWSFPYYLVGAAAGGLMITTARAAGWPFSLLVLPILLLIYFSYRLHTHPTQAVQAEA